MNESKQRGIGTITVLVILLILGSVGFASWKLWESKSNNMDTDQVSTQSENGTENKVAQTTETDKTTPDIVITTGDSEFGTMLFNDEGQAIYIWELEDTSEVECYGDCAEAWPPVVTDGEPVAAGEVDSELLGTTKRTDGSTQVTYNGHPLYYYAHEEAGEVKCHNISTHGGLWWVIQPSGVRAD